MTAIGPDRLGYGGHTSNLDAFEELLSGTDYPVIIVTTTSHGQRAGCLVGFATQASMSPPRLLVCLSKANATFKVAATADFLVVHYPGAADLALAQLFGGETGDEVDKFARCQWENGPHGVPVLAVTRGWVAARILERHDVGDHVAYLVEPFEAHAGDATAPQLGFQAVKDLTPGHPA